MKVYLTTEELAFINSLIKSTFIKLNGTGSEDDVIFAKIANGILPKLKFTRLDTINEMRENLRVLKSLAVMKDYNPPHIGKMG